ncbi:MAG TPA: DUF2937 family protein [Opitutaceae bacterium]
MPPPRILLSASKGAERILDRVLCVCGAVGFSQLPEFMQQYLQRLEGHLDEARLQVERFKEAAAQAGTTLDQMIVGAGQNPDPAMARLGGVIRAAVARVDELGAADASMRSASAWTRPFAFLAHVDWGIARATWAIYRPAVPTTAEGLVYAGAGMVFALALYHLCVRAPIAGFLLRRRQARSRSMPVPPA